MVDRYNNRTAVKLRCKRQAYNALFLKADPARHYLGIRAGRPDRSCGKKTGADVVIEGKVFGRPGS